MKSLFLSFALALAPGMAFAETLTCEIKGMTCGSCIQRVEKAICDMPGVAECEVDFHRVVLKAEDGHQLDADLVKELITSTGYTVTKITKSE